MHDVCSVEPHMRLTLLMSVLPIGRTTTVANRADKLTVKLDGSSRHVEAYQDSNARVMSFLIAIHG